MTLVLSSILVDRWIETMIIVHDQAKGRRTIMALRSSQ